MSVERVKKFFRLLGREADVLEFDTSSATVELAAAAVGVEEARIAKTMSFYPGKNAESGGEAPGPILIVAAGDVKIDNKKFKARFGHKAKMLSREDLPVLLGYEAGGVCPFDLPPSVQVYLDKSLQRFETVFPACGSANSAIRLTCDELFEYARAKEWVDVTV